MKYHNSRRKILKWIAISAAALVGLRLFFVQELIAELIIFAVLFGCVAVVALVLLALDEAWQFAFARAETLLRSQRRLLIRNQISVDQSSAVNILTPILERRSTFHG